MTACVRFVVPGNPVPCARARVFVDPRTGKVRSANPARTTNYKREVQAHAHVAALRAHWRMDAANDVGLDVAIYRGDARQVDLDNLYKGIADALIGIYFMDDSQVVELHMKKFVDRDNPRAEVTVFRLPRQPAND